MNKIKKYAKFFLTLTLVLTLVISLATTETLTIRAEAAEATADEGMTFEAVGKKTAGVTIDPDVFEINLSVPGVKAVDEYNEVIVMVDASLSQSQNLENLKKLIIGLGEKVLTEDSTMKLTLMGFGLGPRKAGSFYSVAQLEAFLATATQEDLLQERSATNCEVGFTYVADYINNSPNLKNVAVVYTSDGAANMDETPLVWANWADETVFDYFKTFTKEGVIDYIIGTELEHIFAGNNPMPYTFRAFPFEAGAVAAAELIFGAGSEGHKAALDILSDAINADPDAYVTAFLSDIFRNSGMNLNEGNSASKVEKAFQTYFRTYLGVTDEAYGSYMDLFYVILGDTGYSKLSDRYTRAAAASVSLQQNEKVLGLYHVGYSGASNTWMNPEKGYYEGQDISKLTYVYNTDFASVVGDMIGAAEQIVTMEYRDVIVTDPMSEWVDLIPESIKIVDETTGNVVYTYADNTWSIEPLTAEAPITVSDSENGKKVITWKIKDGSLLYTDHYALRYLVDIDEEADGFQYGTMYPANNPTAFSYIDHNGVAQTEDIAVPDVHEELPTEDFKEGDKGIKVHKQDLKTGAPISGIQFQVYKVPVDEGETITAAPSAEDVAKYGIPENLVDTLTTDVNGYAGIVLEDGVYLLVELANDKVEAPVAPFYVTVPMRDPENMELNYIVDVYPKNDLIPTEPEIPEPEIPEEPENPKTGTFTIYKYDVNDETMALAGAEFQVMRPAAEGEAGTDYSYEGSTISLVPVVDDSGEPIILVTDEAGKVTSPALEVGLYFLVETKSPEGYDLLQGVIPVYAAVEGIEDAPLNISNIPSPKLPSTGGMGTTLFYILGIVLMIGAVAVLIFKKRSAR